MAVKLRLARHGSKKRPFYWIVAADSRKPRDGKFIEKLGTYDPRKHKNDDSRVILQTDRIKYWLSVGAQPTDRVQKLLGKDYGKKPPLKYNPIKGKISNLPKKPQHDSGSTKGLDLRLISESARS